MSASATHGGHLRNDHRKAKTR